MNTFKNIPGHELTFGDLLPGDIFVAAYDDHITVKGAYPGQQHLPGMPAPNYFDPRWPTLYARCGDLFPVKKIEVPGLLYLRPCLIIANETTLGTVAGLYD